MKQLIVFWTVFVFCVVTKAQDHLMLKQGSRLQYSVTVGGRTFPMFALIESLTADNLSLAWNFESGRSGKFIMKRPSLDSARFGYWNQPIDGEELELPASQNVLFLSRLIFSSLQKKKEAVFDEYTIKVKPPVDGNAFKLKNRIIDAIAVTGDSGAKIWVLNNPDTPLILKIEGNPFGVDVELTEIN